MELREILLQQLKEKRMFDMEKMNYMSNMDIKVCDYVSSQLPFIDIKGVYVGKDITLDELKKKSLDELKVFGAEVYSSANSIISEVPIELIDTDDFQFGTGVSYNHLNDGTIIPDSGIIHRYVVPKNISEFSIYNFTHEQIHGLKETNYDEYHCSLVIGETIPLFYELISNGPNEILKQELIKFRLYNLYGDKEDYEIFRDLYENTSMFDLFISNDGDVCSKKGLYDFIRLKRGRYLNSFYYALILYNMYKETPKKILDLVSRVLTHEMTTIQLLEYLNIYGDIRGEVFEKEMRNIRKLVK